MIENPIKNLKNVVLGLGLFLYTVTFYFRIQIYFWDISNDKFKFKGIVSRDFRFHIAFKVQSFERVRLFNPHLMAVGLYDTHISTVRAMTSLNLEG